MRWRCSSSTLSRSAARWRWYSSRASAEGAQLGVPVGFQRIGDESVRRVDVHVALAGEVGLVLCALDLTVAQPIGVVDDGAGSPAGRRASARAPCGVTASTSSCADRGVDLRPDDALAERVAEEPTAADAHVRGERAGSRRVL